MGYPGSDAALAAIEKRLTHEQALEALLALMEAELVVVPRHFFETRYTRPQDTTAWSVRCTGSKQLPVAGSIRRDQRNHLAASGLCPVCDRRIRLYSNEVLAFHKHGT